ncbi:hypothetical protein [Nocardioides sambongensis]|uniref:hypothetical protein n=1 Tax=Nocardioides sambongensis TaxID=2589074 RepID=UPI001126D464|nr:hypothetical protein [Nocardioides sambongensis]
MSQPPPPYQPYQQPMPPSPYQKPKSNGGKIAAIVIAAVLGGMLIFCGGPALAFFLLASSVEDSISEFDGDRRGGPDNPIALEEGEAFTIDGIQYDEGWRVQPPADEYSRAEVVGLRGTNERDSEDSKSVSLDFTFLRDNEEVGEISCSSEGQISYTRSETLDCRSYTDLGDWRSIEVSAAY